jgi:DNA-directed RNA polymerase specialized sigma24 family protein
LLLSILSADEATAAEQYELLRMKTVRFFQWKGAVDAEELTDETILRVGRKLGEGAPVGQAEIGPYVRGVARMVFLESLRSEERDRKLREHAAMMHRIEVDADAEHRIDCLEAGLAALESSARALIIGYYSDGGEGKIEQRKGLAESLGISMTALRIRAHRLRERLTSSVLRCIEESS